MRKLRKTMAILLSIVMMGTMPGAVSSITVCGAQTSESEDTATLAAASGLGVASHTQEEIIEHIKDSGALITDDTVYKTAYSDEEPYSAGELDESTLNSGIAMLNNIRYIAGLNYDVTLDDEFNKECQAGALIGKIYGTIDHHPQQPSGMSDELYQLAYKGCSESNIAWGYSTLNKCIVLGWMSDEDDSNISRVGHRAWCLNPTMGKTGFGVVDNYYNMHSFDRSYTSSIKNISWPAQNMPVEYFEKNMPWSIFTGSSETADSVKVTLTRQSDGKVWNFSQDSADGYFNVTDYIQSGTIIFRPNDITGYNEGDVFTVSVTGVKTPLSYTVTFFSLGSDLGHIHTFGNSSFVVTSADLDAMTLEGTMACDSCGQKFNASEGTITNILTENVTCGFKGYVQFKFTAKVYGTQWGGTNFYYVNCLPHKYGDVEFTWNGTECTADATCSRCGEVSSEKCTVTSSTTATCTKDGQTIYTAEYGGKTDTLTVDTPATGHSFTDYESNNDATCSADGTKTAECDYGCGTTDTIADEGTKLDHKFTNYVSNDDATCSEDGTKTAECDYGCGTTDTIVDEGSSTKAHIFTKYVSDNNATCQKDGTKTAECDYGCGTTDTVVDEGTKLDHKFTDYVSDNNATCQKDGTKTAECDYGCGATDTVVDEGSKTSHKFTKYVSNDDATCSEDGTKTAECDYGCGETDTVVDEGSSSKAHKFTKYVSDNNATCSEDGTKTAECDYGCGTTDTVEDEGTKLDHKFTDYVSNGDATCQKDGTKTAKCDYGCGTTDTVEDEGTKLDHKFTDYVYNGDATCQKDGTKTARCDYGCGEKDTVVASGTRGSHSYGRYVSNDDATCMKDGTKTATCAYCGAKTTTTDEGSKTAHRFTKYVSNGDATCESDETQTAQCDYGCGTRDTRVVSGTKLAHKFTGYSSNNDATCSKDGTATAECDYGCGRTKTIVDEGTRKPHIPSGVWSVSDKATDKADGTLVDRCTECGQIAETQRIPQIDKVKLAYTICTYDGNAKKPGVSVYDVDGNTLDRTSYTVSYRNNKTSGDAAVVVTFKGDYAGSITASFVIKPKSVPVKAATNTAGGAKITWSKAASGTGYIVYRSVNGSSYRKYKTINGLSTTSMVDSGARKSGTKYAYKICVYRAVNGHTYTSAASSAKAMYYMAAPSWKSLKNSSASAITVKYGKAAGAAGYQIQYSANSSMKSAKTVKVSGASTITKVIRSLRKNKKYYVRVRSFKNVGGRTYYSTWNAKKSVMIRK